MVSWRRPTGEVEQCTSCRAKVRFAKHDTTGAVSPYDDAPTADGTHTLALNSKGELVAHLVPPHLAFGTRKELHASHFKTCPNRARHKRRRT